MISSFFAILAGKSGLGSKDFIRDVRMSFRCRIGSPLNHRIAGQLDMDTMEGQIIATSSRRFYSAQKVMNSTGIPQKSPKIRFRNCTPPKFNSEFTPEKLPKPKRKDRLPTIHFQVQCQNFGGVAICPDTMMSPCFESTCIRISTAA